MGKRGYKAKATCSKGHEIAIVERTKAGNCKLCQQEYFMKKTKEKSKEIKQETHPKTYELLKELKELLTDREEYKWG